MLPGRMALPLIFMGSTRRNLDRVGKIGAEASKVAGQSKPAL